MAVNPTEPPGSEPRAEPPGSEPRAAPPGSAGSAAGLPERVARLGVPDLVYRVLRGLVRGINRLWFRVDLQVEEPVPDAGPVILAPVHRSFLDFLVVSEVTRRKIFYMAKDDLWKSPLLGSFLEAIGAFPVNRSGADRLALDRAQEVLERGDALIVFPEGTRRHGPVVEDLQEGAAFLAARTGAPVVPIGVGGSARAMPKGSKLVRPVKIHLRVGRALPAPARTGRGRVPRSQVHAFSEQIRAELQRLFDQAEAAAADSHR